MLWAADWQRCLRFYRELFGGVVSFESEVWSEIVIAGATLGIHGGGEGKRTWTGLSFQIDDLREGITRLIECGGGLAPDYSRLRFFGHSLGAAAVLIGASESGIQRGVLLSPFTSKMEMSRRFTGLPLDFLVTHRYDNRARLAELATPGTGGVIILHGTRDEVIPLAMSETLAAERKDSVRFVPVPDGRHNDIPHRHAALLAASLNEGGRPAAPDYP